MDVRPFQLERYFARYEFKTRHLLSPSDCESISMRELLGMADPQTQQLWDELRLGYTESPGHPLLREEVSRLYQDIPPDGVLMAIPEEAIFIAMNCLLQPDDHVVVLSPIYQSLFEVARAIGCPVTAWPLEPREGRWHLDLDRLESLLTPKTRLLVVNFPNNPTGFIPGANDFGALVDLARSRGIFLFSDEMYRQLEHDPARRLPAVCDLYERGISLSGLSKAYGLPGLRTGWLACQDIPLINRFQAFKDYTTICASAPAEVLSIVALRAGGALLARNLGIVQHNLAAAERFFSSRPAQFEWLRPDGGSTAFPRWLDKDPVDRFCNEMVDRRGVMVVPGSMFDFPGNYFRVGLGRAAFPEVLAVVEEYLDQRDPSPVT
jgi:aspartate/methionine/tyrosine aminotransferase